MFGGYLVFYTKKSKALNINIKTDYWAHTKTGSITQHMIDNSLDSLKYA